MKFKAGAAHIQITLKPKFYHSESGYARAAGFHFDFRTRVILGVRFYYMRPRENDYGHPVCHAGIRWDDRIANPQASLLLTVLLMPMDIERVEIFRQVLDMKSEGLGVFVDVIDKGDDGTATITHTHIDQDGTVNIDSVVIGPVQLKVLKDNF